MSAYEKPPRWDTDKVREERPELYIKCKLMSEGLCPECGCRKCQCGRDD